jgi:hypothetical protein
MLRVHIPTHAESPLVTPDNAVIRAFIEANSARPDIEWRETPAEADCILLFERWSTKFWHYASDLRKDEIFSKHRDKVLCVNQDDAGRGFLAGCYTSLKRSNFSPRVHRAIPYLSNYNTLIDSYAVEHERDRRYLFSFRGAKLTNPIRGEIVRRFATHPNAKIVCVDKSFGKHSEDDMRSYIEDILDSQFVLCPAGWGPQTYRLFDCMQLGRCPVIISDEWVPIAGIPWHEFALRVPAKQVRHLPGLLSARMSDAASLGRAARQAWMMHCGSTQRFVHLMDQLQQLWNEIQTQPVDYDALHYSWRFYYANQFTLPQRVRGGLARRIYQLYYRAELEKW